MGSDDGLSHALIRIEGGGAAGSKCRGTLEQPLAPRPQCAQCPQRALKHVQHDSLAKLPAPY
jgi:hypothetical protein